MLSLTSVGRGCHYIYVPCISYSEDGKAACVYCAPTHFCLGITVQVQFSHFFPQLSRCIIPLTSVQSFLISIPYSQAKILHCNSTGSDLARGERVFSGTFVTYRFPEVNQLSLRYRGSPLQGLYCHMLWIPPIPPHSGTSKGTEAGLHVAFHVNVNPPQELQHGSGSQCRVSGSAEETGFVSLSLIT